MPGVPLRSLLRQSGLPLRRALDLGRQIAAVALQSDVTGVINVGSGTSVSLGEHVERFIRENGLDITLKYGAFPDRPYDSREIYGDATAIRQLMATVDGAPEVGD